MKPTEHFTYTPRGAPYPKALTTLDKKIMILADEKYMDDFPSLMKDGTCYPHLYKLSYFLDKRLGDLIEQMTNEIVGNEQVKNVFLGIKHIINKHKDKGILKVRQVWRKPASLPNDLFKQNKKVVEMKNKLNKQIDEFNASNKQFKTISDKLLNRDFTDMSLKKKVESDLEKKKKEIAKEKERLNASKKEYSEIVRLSQLRYQEYFDQMPHEKIFEGQIECPKVIEAKLEEMYKITTKFSEIGQMTIEQKSHLKNLEEQKNQLEKNCNKLKEEIEIKNKKIKEVYELNDSVKERDFLEKIERILPLILNKDDNEKLEDFLQKNKITENLYKELSKAAEIIKDKVKNFYQKKSRCC